MSGPCLKCGKKKSKEGWTLTSFGTFCDPCYRQPICMTAGCGRSVHRAGTNCSIHDGLPLPACSVEGCTWASALGSEVCERHQPEKAPARKDDAGKPRWSLLPWLGLAAVIEVLEYGARKYAAHAWQRVEDAEARYTEAYLRHTASFAAGEEYDPESNLTHLSHAACNALFLLWLRAARGALNRRPAP